MKTPRRLIFAWATLWLIGLLFTEVSHGILHHPQDADGGVGVCAVCTLQNTPAPLVADIGGTITTISCWFDAEFACPETVEFVSTLLEGSQNSRAPPVSSLQFV